MVALAALVLAGVTATYVGVVNAGAVKGSQIRQLEREMENLKRERRELTLAEAAAKAFQPPKDDEIFVPVEEK